MASGIRLDLTTFRAGLRRKLSATRRATPDVANRAARDVCLRAITFTPKADAAKIEADLHNDGLVFKLLQSSSMQHRLPPALRGFTNRTHRRAQIDDAARKLIALRRHSVAYIKSGWITVAHSFGGALGKPAKNKSLAGKSYGQKATVSAAVASGTNLARGATLIGTEGLQKALDYVGKDMSDYAAKKLAAPWR